MLIALDHSSSLQRKSIKGQSDSRRTMNFGFGEVHVFVSREKWVSGSVICNSRLGRAPGLSWTLQPIQQCDPLKIVILTRHFGHMLFFGDASDWSHIWRAWWQGMIPLRKNPEIEIWHFWGQVAPNFMEQTRNFDSSTEIGCYLPSKMSNLNFGSFPRWNHPLRPSSPNMSSIEAFSEKQHVTELFFSNQKWHFWSFN